MLTKEQIKDLAHTARTEGFLNEEDVLKLCDTVVELQRLRKEEAERAWFMLDLHEWPLDTDGTSRCCPQCDAYKEEGHEQDCGLKADLKHFKAIAEGK